MKRNYIRHLGITAAGILLLAGATSLSHARSTSNPVELVVSGGFTMNAGVARTTRLYLDFGEQFSDHEFWVKVEDDPGIPPDFGGLVGPDGVEISPMASPKTVSIKYFPISRYVEIIIAMSRIQTFGPVNPYSDGFIICDAPNSDLRLGNRTVSIQYNCGSDDPDADAATLETDALLKSLTAETISDPDIQGTLPR
ncbi:MAG: hypothetical protein AB8B63_13805 [Granulosicoccus sp.]